MLMTRTATLALFLAGVASASAASAEGLLSDDVRAKLSGELVWSDAVMWVEHARQG